MLTLGTAGHVDHGKSTLIKALTSIDPDRLPEEKRRGITIDLGFAWLKSSTGEMVGIVDVPGHKSFIRNVIPGLGGIDAALLVVAADDGWMPQTEEHAHILDLIGVKHGIVALTKVDLVDDPGWLELVEADIGERLAQTSLRNSPIIRINSIDGTGIKEIKEAIDRLVLKIAPRKDLGKPRLPIDRVFVMKGSGVVVTGTLQDGCLASGDDVVISPGGLTARIRSIESYKQKVEKVQPGSRVALNLSGAKKEQLKRGDIILANRARLSRVVNTEIRLIPQSKRLKSNNELIVYLETRELLARVIPLGAKAIQSQEPALAQLQFEEDVATYIGEHFILRWQSPLHTIGGGIIIDPLAAKYKLGDVDKVIAFLESRRELGLEELIVSELKKHGHIEKKKLLVASLYKSSEIAEKVALLKSQSRLVTTNSYVIDPKYWQGQIERALELLAREHALNPRSRLSQGELESYLALPKEVFDRVIEALTDSGQVIREEDTILLTTHKTKLAQEAAKVADFFARNRSNPTTKKILTAEIPGSNDLIRSMCRQNMLVEMDDGVIFDREGYEDIKGTIICFLRDMGQISIQDVNTLFGFSRKYTLPLLNYLDREGITRREGDVRILASKK